MKKWIVSLLCILLAATGFFLVSWRGGVFPLSERQTKIFLISFGVLGSYGFTKLWVFCGKKLKNNYGKTWFFLVENGLKYLAFLVGIFMLLSVFGVDTTALATGAGALTVIVGLGCQSLFSDIISGVFLVVEGNIKIGDVVEIGGFRGTVQQMSIRTTSLLDAEGNIKTVNNSSIQEFINRSARPSVAVLDVGISYEESIERVEEVLKKNLPFLLQEVPSATDIFYKGISALDESCIRMKLLAACSEENKYQAQRELNRAVKLLFDKEGIRLPYRHLVVHNQNE